MNRGRRSLLSGGALALGAAAIGGFRSPALADALEEPPVDRLVMPPRRLALYNLHTDESLEVEYHREGAYVPEALTALEGLLRDFRTGDRHPMDPALFDVLYDVARHVGVDPQFRVISGYRSPATNAMLHERSHGVASRSMHLQGKAIDVRLAGVDCAALATSGLALARGGVGYYRRSDFVHLDTGGVRSWRG